MEIGFLNHVVSVENFAQNPSIAEGIWGKLDGKTYNCHCLWDVFGSNLYLLHDHPVAFWEKEKQFRAAFADEQNLWL